MEHHVIDTDGKKQVSKKLGKGYWLLMSPVILYVVAVALGFIIPPFFDCSWQHGGGSNCPPFVGFVMIFQLLLFFSPAPIVYWIVAHLGYRIFNRIKQKG